MGDFLPLAFVVPALIAGEKKQRMQKFARSAGLAAVLIESLRAANSAGYADETWQNLVAEFAGMTAPIWIPALLVTGGIVWWLRR